jgi:hypothetical protein
LHNLCGAQYRLLRPTVIRWKNEAQFIGHKMFDFEIGTMGWGFNQPEGYLVIGQSIQHLDAASTENMDAQLWPITQDVGQ